MDESQKQPWSDNPNAPGISYDVYFEEKAKFAGILLGSILYGVLIVLFFQCMAALFNPINRRRDGIRWRLVSFATLMFSFVTVFIAANLDVQSISYIDNREFLGVEGALPPGPLGYQSFIRPEVLSVIPSIMFLLNYWLADGLLLYRCYVIYSMNLWVVVFPCLMYLASMAMGIMMVISQAWGRDDWVASAIDFGRPYFVISTSLNLLLTLMIVVRLVLHSKNIRAAMGFTAGIGGQYQVIMTMLIESSALYAVSSLLIVAQSSRGVADIFLPSHAVNQVIAPLLIVRRVADQNALTSNTIASGRTTSFRVRSQGESTGSSGVISGGGTAGVVDESRKNSGQLGVSFGVETSTIDLHRDKF